MSPKSKKEYAEAIKSSAPDNFGYNQNDCLFSPQIFVKFKKA